MKFQIAVIDDDKSQAVRFATLISELLASTSLSPELNVSVSFEVVALYPHPLEQPAQFIERLKAFLRCDEEFAVYREAVSQPTSMDELEHLSSISSIDLQCAIVDYKLDEAIAISGSRATGFELLRLLQDLRPNVQRILLSSLLQDQMLDRGETSWHDYFNKTKLIEKSEQIRFRQAVVHFAKRRCKTPLWDGLKSYMDAPKVVMHAMAISEGKSIQGEGTYSEFASFYGENSFFAEASLTLPPLDSIFTPTGSIAAAQSAYADSFGAGMGVCRAVFSTNGTSTANKIVTETVSSAGDIVLIDRNCHISHHFAYINHGLNPVFLEPPRLEQFDIAGAITAPQVAEALENVIVSQDCVPSKAKLPAVVTITNCSFDGFLTSAIDIVQQSYAVLEKLSIESRFSEIAFLFDEAWFGFGKFHPQTVEFSASHAMQRCLDHEELRNNARIYSTTSVHKTLSAMRQTSAVVTSEPAFRPAPADAASNALRFKLQQSVSNHTTTSPNYSLLASIDVARRQIDIEGVALVSEAISSAEYFKQRLFDLSKDPRNPLARVFRPLDGNALVAELDQALAYDPTKVLLQVTNAMGGAQAKSFLWKTAGVQVNKFSKNTVLLMFMIGFSRVLADQLIDKLEVAAEAFIRMGHPVDDFGSHGSRIDLPIFNKYLASNDTICQAPKGYFAGQDMAGSSVLKGKRSQDIVFASISELSLQSATHTFISAGFVTPYPPGYPILVPGQVIGAPELAFLQSLDNPEIHGVQRSNMGEIVLSVIKMAKTANS